MRLMHQFHHEIKMDEQKMNNFVNIPFYRYNLHFRGRQKILGSPMDQRQIQNEKIGNFDRSPEPAIFQI